MIILRAFLLLTLLAGAGFAQSQEPGTQGARVVGTRVNLVPPAGFTPSPQAPGYWLESLGASIMVTEMPGPFGETSAAFSNPSLLSKRGMSLLNKQEIKVNARNGLLAKVKQNVFGMDYLKWLLVFGDEKETVMIVAAFPEELEGELSEKLKASILTATWDAKKVVSPTEGLNYTIDVKGELKLANRMSNLLSFSKGGIFPSKDIDDPFFVVGQSVVKMDFGDTEQYTKARILKTATIKNIEIVQSNKVTIDNLNGYEVIARATDEPSGQPMVVYHVMLFEEQGYFMMQGLVSVRNQRSNLEIFKQMARTFKRKKQ